MTTEYYSEKNILIIRNELGKIVKVYIGSIVQKILESWKSNIQ